MSDLGPLIDYDRSLEGKPLRYLIGASDEDLAEQGIELKSHKVDQMADAPWYDDARADIGRYHDGPDVPMLALQVAAVFPDQLAYAREAGPDTSWCGIWVAAKLAKYGIRPPYTPPGNNVGSWMYADSWADTSWGTPIPIGQEQPGDIAVWRVPHHVNMVSENGKFIGGNQSDGVSEISMNRSGLRAIIRPPPPGAIAQPNPKPTQPVPAPVPLNPALSNFKTCLPLLLVHEGGNDDDPRDPGGRTSRGILQREWDVWRQTHPGLPSDVWQAPQDQVEAIYKLKYWDAMSCDALPSGVDYAIFDYGVNSGIGRAPKVLQRIVGTDADGEIGPLTIAATAQADARSVINQICDERMAFLQALSTWPTFGRGWTTRVSDVRRDALAMAAVSRPPPDPVIIPPPKPGNPMPENPMPFNPALEDAMTAIRPIVAKLVTASGPRAPTAEEIRQFLLGTLNGTVPALPPPVILPPGTPNTGTPPPATTTPPPSNPGATVDKAAVGLSGFAGALASILMAFGVVGTPAGLGTDPTTTGTLSTLVPLITGLTGYAGGFSSILSGLGSFFGRFTQQPAK